MKLLCALFTHWPSAWRLRRRNGRWESRCRLCGTGIQRADGRWYEGGRFSE